MNSKNNLMRFMLIILSVLLTLSTIGYARSLTPPPSAHRIWDVKWIDINQWRVPFYNDGRYGIRSTSAGDVAGGSWPYPYNNYYIFGAGPWVGAIKGADTLVTVGYNPNTGRGEFFPTSAQYWEEGSGNGNDRIYKFPSDWPPPQSRFGTDTTLVPQRTFSLQDMWGVYCDLSPDYHTSPGRPLGIEVFQTIYAWNYPTNQDIFFMVYKIRNANATDTIKRMYLGACMDADIGDAADDMVGMMKETFLGGDTVRNVGYAGDNDNVEATNWQTGTPGVVAMKFLEGPRDASGNLLGMTSFKKFTIDIDPMLDGDQYKTMAGYDYRTGIRSPYDSIDITPADKRFIECTGPFDLAPGALTTIIVGVMAAPYGNASEPWASRDTSDLQALAKLASNAQYIYDKGWLLPGPPIASNAVLIPGDNSIRLVWDDLPERTPDPYYEIANDPAYRRYDFEGYKIYKSTDGANWSLMTQCDLADGIMFKIVVETIINGSLRVVNTQLIYGDTTSGQGIITRAYDNGVFYSLVDNTVTNGLTYYYRVAGYDLNFVTNPSSAIDTISLESNPTPVSIRPRWEAPNYTSDTVNIIRVIGDMVHPGVKYRPNIVIPYEVTSDTLKIEYAGPKYGGASNKALYRFTVKTLNDSLVLDTTRFTYTIGTILNQQLPPFGGSATVAVCSIAASSKTYDSIYPISGNYSPNRLALLSVFVSRAQWAFRGSDYKIKWHVSGANRTCEVFDMTNNGVAVPSTRFTLTGSDTLANGYCFTTAAFSTPSETLTPTKALIYLNCGYIALNHVSSNQPIGSLIDSIAEGDEWFINGYTGNGTAPYYNVLYMVGDPQQIRSDTTYKLKVKVVPNPYIVTNGWETNSMDRKLAFTRLPAECTIRIFTMAGNLVKVIEHKDIRNIIDYPNAQPLELGGTEYWNLLNEHDQLISSGVYIFHIESKVGEQIGKFAVVE
jgi:hypothetical protein